MFIDRLINQGNAPLIEKMVSFTAQRHELIAENIANVSTPGYVQKDFAVEQFQNQLRSRLEARRAAPPGSVRYDDIKPARTDARTGLLFHDRGNRSVEQMMSDLSSNALRHNMFTELLRKQFDSMQTVLRERVA